VDHSEASFVLLKPFLDPLTPSLNMLALSFPFLRLLAPPLASEHTFSMGLMACLY
jgi:hypothetical protein